ncbi:NTE family protein [Natronocella acetinitrilica]|uniref:NTE family protein n=1 Tax=Natronocella acetinitrilica TaxID=414046 RepID=A0AAE3G704_9GAMM|nr:patatin-like phospholipase family protein [Natronocella acetinitrilica]MCP1676214.1 NTE family protein [Natronocella acetinitrilica]
MTSRSKTVSLVLGAGGARGLAHIGAIEELVDQGYDIQAIAGCSMGALVGGIYALNKLDVYRDWVTSLEQSDVLALLDWTLSRGGLIQGERIISKLREMVGDCNIEDLPLDYTAVTVDIVREQELWLIEGPLFDAIRASIAIPAVFTPHHYRGRTLVDGGLLNPVPVAPTRRTLTDLTIVVDVNGHPGKEVEAEETEDAPVENGLLDRLRGVIGGDGHKQPEASGMALSEVLIRSLETMQAAITRQHLAVFQPDLVIHIPRNACMIHEFHKAAEMIELGRRMTRDRLARHYA